MIYTYNRNSMLLKGRTENKKLNLNQPIPSVRRCSKMMTLHKIDKTKIENSLPIIPRPTPPPHKSVPVKSPGSVPFQWEEIPGQPKEHLKPQTHTFDRPKLPPARYTKDNSHTRLSLSKNFKIETKEEITYSSDSGDCDEASVDAPRSFFSDPQTPKFMMDRFLPSANTMVSVTHQYSHRNQSSFGEEQPQQHKMRIVNKEENLIAAFGFLPRLCSKSSVCILNHVPAVSVRNRATLPSANKKLQSPPSSADPFTDTKNKYKVKPVGEMQTDKLYYDTPISFLEEKQVTRYLEGKKHNRIKGLESHSQGSKTFQELLLADEGNPKKIELVASVVEKIGILDSGEEDNNISTKRIDQEALARRSHELNMVSSIHRSNIKWGVDNATSLNTIQVDEKEHTKNVCNSGAPPLPKSPPDSWLWRTLPSMSTNNVSLRFQNHGSSKAPKVGIKWESIVKSTKVQQLHSLRYSEDELTPIPEMSEESHF